MRLRYAMDDDAGYVPEYAHEGDAGMDLRATAHYMIPPHACAMVGTGLHVEIPEGYVGLVFPRSGLGSKGLTLRNAVGVVDSGFRGEIRAALWNTTGDWWTVRRGDRVCQMVVMPYVRCELEYSLLEELDDSERGSDGYGSTGVR